MCQNMATFISLQGNKDCGGDGCQKFKEEVDGMIEYNEEVIEKSYNKGSHNVTLKYLLGVFSTKMCNKS